MMNIILLIFVIIVFLILCIPNYTKPIVIKNFLKENECDGIIENNNELINKLYNKCLKLTDRPIKNIESFEILKFKKDEYKEFVDIINDNKLMHTFILSLNDNYKGGDINFYNLNETFSLNKGDILFINNLDEAENITSKSSYIQNKVDEGEKIIGVLKIRKYQV